MKVRSGRRGWTGDEEIRFKTQHRVLRNLGTEGFNENSMHVIERYLDRETREQARRREGYNRAKEEFRTVMRGLSLDKRQAIHAFLNMSCAHSFHAGIRLGLSGHRSKEELDRKAEEVDEG